MSELKCSYCNHNVHSGECFATKMDCSYSPVYFCHCPMRTNPIVAYVDPEPIHSFFGLTYANYLVLRRSHLQSMPQEWQAKFVKMLEELSEYFGSYDIPDNFQVYLRDEKGRFMTDPVPHYNRGRTVIPKRKP